MLFPREALLWVPTSTVHPFVLCWACADGWAFDGLMAT